MEEDIHTEMGVDNTIMHSLARRHWPEVQKAKYLSGKGNETTGAVITAERESRSPLGHKGVKSNT